MKLEIVDCPLCDSSANTPVHDPATFAPYQVVECSACRLLFLSPRLAEEEMLGRYREGDYFERHGQSGYSDYRAQEQSLRSTFRRCLRQLEELGRTGGRLLEVGCGYGFFLREAEPFFEGREGTEYSEAAAEQARTWADEIHVGGLDAVPVGRSFDLLVANQVIEHVYEPMSFLKALKERVRPGGAILITTPDAGSFWRRRLGANWPSYVIPDHVTFFRAKQLEDALRRAGFEAPSTMHYWHAFPLSLVLEKLGVRIWSAIGGVNVWLPKTTVAAVAGRPGNSGRSKA